MRAVGSQNSYNFEDSTKFPEDCEALLIEVFHTTGLFTSNTAIPARKITLLVLGFSSGDQTEYLTRRLRRDTDQNNVDTSIFGNDSPFIDKYVGVTLGQGQFNYEKNRLANLTAGNRSGIRIFCADGANPQTWPAELVT